MIENRKTADLPLAVWPCAQRTSQWQRYGRYLAESDSHTDKMLPALTRRAVETYSKPGALVVDPMRGIGTTLVEAIDLGPRAIGVELEPRWAKHAAANIEHAYEDQRTRSLAQVTARVPQAPDGGNQSEGGPDAEGGLTMLATAREAGGDGLEVCRFGGSIAWFCQGLEITARVWSDRSKRCTLTGHGKQRPCRPFFGRRLAQATGVGITSIDTAAT